jgi:two-component system phosphate regulon sensor histidine kinase PhoR
LGHWKNALSELITPTIVGLIVWGLFGKVAALVIFGLYLSALLIFHYVHLSKFRAWLLDPTVDNIPTATGVWDYLFTRLVRLLKQQRASEITLTKALDRFQRGAQALPDGVIFLDRSNAITWCNPKAEEFFEISLERDRGVQISYLFRQPKFREYLLSRDHDEPYILRLSRNNISRVIAIQIVPYGSAQKLLLARDITSGERLETMRRDFIANVSHELRTPLTVIQGYLETFEDEDMRDAETLTRGIELMSDQSSRMTRLVSDLLTLSKLETSSDSLKEDYIDIPALLNSLESESIALSAGKHQLTFSVDASLCLIGREEEIRSAFANLVSNAIRYSPDGGNIEITWSTVDSHPTFSCKDSGLGIEQQHIERLTERFYRIDKSRSRETGGTGLGLAIVKHIANRHAADLVIKSRLGDGSIFSLRFPPTRETPARNQPASD